MRIWRLNAPLASAQDARLTRMSPVERQALADVLTRVLDYHASP